MSLVCANLILFRFDSEQRREPCLPMEMIKNMNAVINANLLTDVLLGRGMAGLKTLHIPEIL